MDHPFRHILFNVNMQTSLALPAINSSKVPQIHPSKVKNYKRKAPPADSPIQGPQPTFEDEDFEKEARESFLKDFDEFPFEHFTDDKGRYGNR